MSTKASTSMRFKSIRFLYSVMLISLIPILILLNRRKLNLQHDSLKARRFAERFGWTPAHFKKNGIHIHCVSIGELNAANGLIRKLLREYPTLAITITTSSVTGAIHAHSLFKGSEFAGKIQHCYLPIDFPWFMRRFYNALKPKLVLITEVEIWPNMVARCVKLNIPVCLINARMTTKSLNSYRKVSWLFRPTLRQMHAICVQSSESFENFLAFGVYKYQLKLSRNMKFDLLPNEQDDALGKKIKAHYQLQDRPVLLVASSHDPEEKMLLDVYKRLKSQFEQLVLIVVPRHPHRFDDVHHIINASGYNTERVSGSTLVNPISSALKPNKKKPVDCIIVDVMGWLKACYSICDLTFIGGSFAPKGGHNALEAALYGRPIVMGPSVFNNPNICQHLQEQNALMLVDDPQALHDVLEYWLQHPQLAALDGERGTKVLLRNVGAIEFTMSILRKLL